MVSIRNTAKLLLSRLLALSPIEGRNRGRELADRLVTDNRVITPEEVESYLPLDTNHPL